MVRLRTNHLVVLLAALAFAADQGTKALILDRFADDPAIVAITPFLNLTLSFNQGVSFGLLRETLADHPDAVALAKAALGAGLLAWAILARRSLERAGLALLAGGAFGNALDRWWRGGVTDFIDLHAGGLHWPTFNVADIAIVGGCALMLVDVLFGSSRHAPAAAGR
jgi:signal peptidase II